MERQFIIVDDFYDDPKNIRNLALGLEYPAPEAKATYPGRNSHAGVWDDKIAKRISDILGEVIQPDLDSANGLFRISLEKDVHEQDIHIDPGPDWAGVLFLNPDEQCQGGTYFWKHKKYGFEKCPLTPEEGAKYGFTSYEQIREEIIYNDGLDRSKWFLTMAVQMKFNRLVLFRPWMWHSHGRNFGTGMQNGRLVQLFFLKSKSVTTQKLVPSIDIQEQMIANFNDHHKHRSTKTGDGSVEYPKIVEKYFFQKY